MAKIASPRGLKPYLSYLRKQLVSGQCLEQTVLETLCRKLGREFGIEVEPLTVKRALTGTPPKKQGRFRQRRHALPMGK